MKQFKICTKVLILKLGLEKLREELQKLTLKQNVRKSLLLKLLETFQQSGNKPEWMVVTSTYQLLTDLRPLTPLDGGRFATSDLNDLYRRVINHQQPFKTFIKLSADLIPCVTKTYVTEALLMH